MASSEYREQISDLMQQVEQLLDEDRLPVAQVHAVLTSVVSWASNSALDAESLNCMNLLGLSGRESQILEYVARGLSNKEIGKQLWVTEQTIKFHLSNVFRKLGVNNRTEATMMFLRTASAADGSPA